MKKFKKLICMACAALSCLTLSKNIYAKPYDVIVKKDDFATLNIVGFDESNGIAFEYICESFYYMYKDLYEILFGRCKPKLILNGIDIYNDIKKCKGPTLELASDKGCLCDEIDPNRGDRSENEDDREFLSQYFNLDKNLAATLHKIICKNIIS